MELHKFISSVERYNEIILKLNGDEQKLLLYTIIKQLKGQAYRVVNNSDCDEWQEVKTALINNFKDREAVKSLTVKLRRNLLTQ